MSDAVTYRLTSDVSRVDTNAVMLVYVSNVAARAYIAVADDTRQLPSSDFSARASASASVAKKNRSSQHESLQRRTSPAVTLQRTWFVMMACRSADEDFR